MCVGRFPLPYDRRLLLMLSPGSFWMGLEPLSEASLRTLWLPACFLVVLTAAASLVSSRLALVCFPFRGPTPVLHMFLSLGPLRSRSPIPSLASSRWNHCPLLRGGLTDAILLCPARALCFSLSRSRLSILFAWSPLSHRVFADGIYPLLVVALAAGASPHALGSVGAHGVRGGSTYITLHRT